jgi:hypothetical protein
MNSERKERQVYAKAAEYADFFAFSAPSWRSWRLKRVNAELLYVETFSLTIINSRYTMGPLTQCERTRKMEKAFSKLQF